VLRKNFFGTQGRSQKLCVAMTRAVLLIWMRASVLPRKRFAFSGLPPTWIQQITNYDTLAVRDEDNWATLRSGYYGMPQVERWLGIEADYAVISPEALNVFAEGFHGHPEVNRPKVARIRALLAERFERIDRVAEYPYYSYEVYRRVWGDIPRAEMLASMSA